MPDYCSHIDLDANYGTNNVERARILLVPEQVNMFIQNHHFTQNPMTPFTTSERRQFEHDVYAYGRALGLSKKEAEKHVRRAREFCGENEEKYNSDVSALGDEVDDWAEILKRLSESAGAEPGVLSAAKDATNRSMNDAKDNILPPLEAGGSLPSRKRKADQLSKDQTVKRESSHSNNEPTEAKKRKRPRKSKHQLSQGGMETSSELDHRAGFNSQPERNSLDQEIEGRGHSGTGGSNAIGYQTRQNEQSDLRGDGEDKAARKAARRTAKKSRKAQERQERDKERVQNKPTSSTSALDPKTEAEAHANYVKANQRDPHEHGETPEKTEKQKAQSSQQAKEFDAELKGLMQVSNDQQVNLYDSGRLDNARKEVKDDIKDLKEERKYEEEVVKKPRKKKRKSAPEKGEHEPEEASRTKRRNNTSGSPTKAPEHIPDRLEREGAENSEEDAVRKKSESGKAAKPKANFAEEPAGFQSPVIREA